MIVAGCGDDDSSSDSGSDTASDSAMDVSDATLIEDGQLLVGTDAPYPPFEIGTPEERQFHAGSTPT